MLRMTNTVCALTAMIMMSSASVSCKILGKKLESLDAEPPGPASNAAAEGDRPADPAPNVDPTVATPKARVGGVARPRRGAAVDEAAKARAEAAALEAEADRLLAQGTPKPGPPVGGPPPPAAPSAGSPLLGVYNCNYHGTVAPAFDFALFNASDYRDYDGKRGTYRFDAESRRILFLTGPMAGSVARQVTARTFQFLDAHGAPTGNYCPFNESRDPNGKRL